MFTFKSSLATVIPIDAEAAESTLHGPKPTGDLIFPEPSPIGMPVLQRRSSASPLSNEERTALSVLELHLAEARDAYLAELRKSGLEILDEHVLRSLYGAYVENVQMLIGEALGVDSVRNPTFESAIQSMRVTSEREMLISQTGILFDTEKANLERKRAEKLKVKRPKESLGYQQLVNEYYSSIRTIYGDAQLHLARLAMAQHESMDQVAVQVYLLRQGVRRPSNELLHRVRTSRPSMSLSGLSARITESKGEKNAQIQALGSHFDTIFGPTGKPTRARGEAIVKAVTMLNRDGNVRLF